MKWRLLERHIDFEINTEEGDYSTDTVFCDTTAQLTKQHLQDYKEIRKIFIFVHDRTRKLIKSNTGLIK